MSSKSEYHNLPFKISCFIQYVKQNNFKMLDFVIKKCRVDQKIFPGMIHGD